MNDHQKSKRQFCLEKKLILATIQANKRVCKTRLGNYMVLVIH